MLKLCYGSGANCTSEVLIQFLILEATAEPIGPELDADRTFLGTPSAAPAYPGAAKPLVILY
jgi:hypothetical protein